MVVAFVSRISTRRDCPGDRRLSHGLRRRICSPEHVSSVSVAFVEPEKFTDVRRADWEHDFHGHASRDRRKFMQETGDARLRPKHEAE